MIASDTVFYGALALLFGVATASFGWSTNILSRRHSGEWRVPKVLLFGDHKKIKGVEG